MPQVFLSHSTVDTEFVMRLRADLLAAGIDVWKAPESILPGEEWVDAIQRGLFTSTHFLLVMTPAASLSKWVKFEMNVAVNHYVQGEMVIVPLDVEQIGGAPGFWGTFQAVGFRRDHEGALKSLVTRIRVESPTHEPETPPPPGHALAVEEGRARGPAPMAGYSLYDEGRPEPPSAPLEKHVSPPLVDRLRSPKPAKNALPTTALQDTSSPHSDSETKPPPFRATPTPWLVLRTPYPRPKALTGNRQRSVPVWVWIGGAAAVVVVVGVTALLQGIGSGERTTATPISPMHTVTPTAQSSAMPVNPMHTVTPTLPAGELARQLAEAGVTRNADWTPYTEEINGVLMALVPVGCFMMGSNDGDSDEQPVHEVCFETPFWIDVYEVTQAQFAQFGGEAARASYFSGDNLPREQITWNEAQSYCALRGARLPTEAEWEYAARGPDGLMYPWGNEFIVDNVVYSGNSGGQTWDVGSKPGGVSWVGALDLSGNVWEWVSDWYSAGYYSTLADGAVSPQGPGSGSYRALRGGSWNDYSVDLRASYRVGNDPAVTYGYRGGFRCALSY